MAVRTETSDIVAGRMAAWDRRARPAIIVAALAPFVATLFVADARDTLFVVVDLVSWAVFVIDLVVRVGIDRRYLRSGPGLFDSAIVVLTFPWYLFSFGDTSGFMSVFRAARLIRLVTATSLGGQAKKLLGRLGKLGLALAAVSLFSAYIVLNAEPPSSGFENFGDALWWTVVSFTTVGYGDLYPVTPLGRFAGLLMMLAGLAALGTVSASLADSFSRERQDDDDGPDAADTARILSAIEDLRGQVAALSARLDDDRGPSE